jgi:hypothetical protein
MVKLISLLCGQLGRGVLGSFFDLLLQPSFEFVELVGFNIL